MKRSVIIVALALCMALSLAADQAPAPEAAPADTVLVLAGSAAAPAESTLHEVVPEDPDALEKARRAVTALRVLSRVGARLLGGWTLDLARALGS